MNIATIETIPISIPYRHDGPLTGFGGTVWPELTYLLIKVGTEDGLTGWGESFGYNVIPATMAAMHHVVAPLARGKSTADIPATMDSLKKPLHLFGRSGPVQYALSGLDIALWDLAGKRANCSIASLIADQPRKTVAAYKSFMRLSDPDRVAKACKRGLDQGYSNFKLHEVTIETVAAARNAIGTHASLMLDVNCAWPADLAQRMAFDLKPYNLKWLEEPVWPPEDIAGLTALRDTTDIPVALGENLANSWSFLPLLESGTIDYFQPSITKMGGISEFKTVAEHATLHGRTIAPHSPYFGPGLLATLQMAAAFPVIGGIEIFGVDLESAVFGNLGLPGTDGLIQIPDGPGLGCDPDPSIIDRYRNNNY